MGQFEKIVVLLIGFFLVTVIIAVTFGPSEDKPFGMGPADETAEGEPDREGLDSGTPPSGTTGSEELAARDREPREGPNPRRESVPGGGPTAPAGGDANEPETRGSGLLALHELALHEEVDPAGEAEDDGGEDPDLLLDTGGTNRAGQPTGVLPPGSVLVTRDGLEDTFEEDIKRYTWQRGDNFVEVARKLYGDEQMSTLLRQFNEGRTYVAPGEKVLVPVFDGRSDSSSATRTDGEAVTPPEPDPSIALGNLYEVVEGDSLWVISKKVYGSGASWEKIYEANRDELSSPDDLTVGMKLRIP